MTGRPVRAAVLKLVLAVFVVDAAALAGYFAAGIDEAGSTTRIAFAIIWTVVTLIVVMAGLARIRAARYGE